MFLDWRPFPSEAGPAQSPLECRQVHQLRICRSLVWARGFERESNHRSHSRQGLGQSYSLSFTVNIAEFSLSLLSQGVGIPAQSKFAATKSRRVALGLARWPSFSFSRRFRRDGSSLQGQLQPSVFTFFPLADLLLRVPLVMQSFSQIDSSITRSYGGSGLGLAISQSLAQLMGGSCTASSEVGVGSVFSFSFVAGQTSPIPNPFPPLPVVRSAFIVSKSEDWASKSVLESKWAYPDSCSIYSRSRSKLISPPSLSLAAFGFAPVHSSSSVSSALSASSRENLVGSGYDVVLVVSESIGLKELGKLKEVQPRAKVSASFPLSDRLNFLTSPFPCFSFSVLLPHSIHRSLQHHPKAQHSSFEHHLPSPQSSLPVRLPHSQCWSTTSRTR